MPTGYTDMIDRDPKLSTKDWVMTGLARAFGICVTLREEGLNLTEEQIRKKIAEDGQSDITWHQNELIKAVQEQVEIANRDPEQWKVEWRKHEEDTTKRNRESIAEAKKIAKRHNQIREDLERIVHAPVSDITNAIAQFGLQQLTTTESECKPYTVEHQSLAAFKERKISSNLRDIEYHTKEKTLAEERMIDRLGAYAQLRKDLDAVLGDNK